MNNKENSGKYIQKFAAAWLLSLALFVLSFILKIKIPTFLPFLFGLLIISIAIIFAKGGYHYVEMKTEKDVFSINYFNLFPFGRSYKTLKIPWSRYYKYEVKTILGGLFHFLILYESTGRGLAKYPAIGISAFNKAERTRILQYIESNKKSS